MDFCTHYSNGFKALFVKADINYDRFIRTTDADHAESVRAFWN
jgi:methionyl-tRNA synthetase